MEETFLVLHDKEAPEFETSRGEQALWRAVITQALMDAGNDSSKSEMRYEKAQAIAWLGSNHPDFYTVCTLADLEPSYVRQKAREAIKRNTRRRLKLRRSALPLETKATSLGQVIAFPLRSR